MFALLLFVLLPLAAQGQGNDPVAIGPDRLLSAAGALPPLTEPHLSRNPTDPSHLLTGAIEVGSGCATFISFDAGSTWTRTGHPLPDCADPWGAILRDSTTVLAVLSAGELLVFRSADGGRSWGEARSFGSGHDHPTFLVDPTDSSLYLISGRGIRAADGTRRWSASVVRSEDAARSFGDARFITPFDLVFEPHEGVVLPGGRLVVPLSDHHAGDGRDITNRSWVVRTDEGGARFSEPSFVAEGCFGPGGWPSLAAAPPTAGRGDRIVFVCVAEAFQGILVRRSDDAGRSWSGPVRADRTVADPRVAIPSVAVDEGGIVVVTWQDRGDDPERRCQRLYVSVSPDAGRTFLPPRPVSSAPSCPDRHEANRGAAGRWPYGGDYSGLVALGGGRFRAVWADARDGAYRLRTAEIIVSF